MKSKSEFINIIQTHSHIIRKAATIYADSKEDQEDLSQEIIYNLWKSYDTFKGQSQISTWIYRVAMNVSIHFLKGKKRKLTTTKLEVNNISTDENTIRDEKWQRIKVQIEKLDLLEKGIILLYLEGKSHQEISELIGISKSNVGTRIGRIKEKLKKRIQKNI